MEVVLMALQVLLGLVILNVWLIRSKRPTRWRGGDALNLREELSNYGLPRWLQAVVGIAKVSLALLLVSSPWLPWLGRPAALALSVLMLGAVLMHLKIRDPARKSMPALTLLLLCLVAASSGESGRASDASGQGPRETLARVGQG
ncbi:MAG: DoxX family protein [Acidobacteriota bacterium]